MAEQEQPGPLGPKRQGIRPRRETIEETLLKNAPWMPASYELADASALKAIAAGTADPEQQRRALDWIMREACGLPKWAFQPGPQERDTNIMLGRHYVGHQIQRLIMAPLGAMRRNEARADPGEPKS